MQLPFFYFFRTSNLLDLTLGFREVFAKQKFGWKKLQVSGISKSLLNSPLGLIFSATMPKAKNQSR